MPLTVEQVAAATLTAHGKPARVCAERAGVCRKTVERWRQLPEFRAVVAEEEQLFRQAIRSTGAADKDKRIRAKKRRLNKLLSIAGKRAGKQEHGGAGWDDTGYVVQREVWVGPPDGGGLHTEFKLDTALLNAINTLEDSIAEEMGDRRKVIQHAGAFTFAPPPKVSERSLELAKLMSRDEILAVIASSAAVQDVAEDGTVITGTAGSEHSENPAPEPTAPGPAVPPGTDDPRSP